MTTVVLDRRFRGPAESANGGFTCGVISAFVRGPVAEVTLRLPPPLERPLTIERRGDGAVLLDGDELVADAVPSALDELEPPRLVSVAEARVAELDYVGADEHPFPGCFVCGPERAPGDGLLLRPSRVGDERLVAATWTPRKRGPVRHGLISPEVVWAALDCPGAFAIELGGRGLRVLGRLAVRIDQPPAVGRKHVVVGWPLGSDGRKHGAGTGLLDESGRVLARGRATWIDIPG
jgi:hypothetical protein